jgi:hypothetical protein
MGILKLAIAASLLALPFSTWGFPANSGWCTLLSIIVYVPFIPLQSNFTWIWLHIIQFYFYYFKFNFKRYDPTDWMQTTTTFYFSNGQIIKSNRRWEEIVHKQQMSNPFHRPGKMSHRCIRHSHFVNYSLGAYQDKPSYPMCSLLHHEACQTSVLLRCTLSKNYLNSEFQNK